MSAEDKVHELTDKTLRIMSGARTSGAPKMASSLSNMSSSGMSSVGRLCRTLRPSGCLTALISRPFTSRVEWPLARFSIVRLNIVRKFAHLNGSPS